MPIGKHKARRRDVRAVLLFLALTLIASAVCYGVILWASEAATALLMWCPGLAAAITVRVFYQGEKVLGLRRCSAKINILSVGLPALYLTVSYGVHWLVFRGFSLVTGQHLQSPILYLTAMIGTVFTALGEELGWRGFLAPRLCGLLGQGRGTLVTGLVWAVWHFPLIIWGGYQAGAPLWYQLPLFTLEIVGIGALMTFLRLRSGSVWPAVLLHASHNYFDQLVFAPSTTGGLGPFLVGETGALTALCVILLTVFIVRNLYYDAGELFSGSTT